MRKMNDTSASGVQRRLNGRARSAWDSVLYGSIHAAVLVIVLSIPPTAD